MFGFKKHMTAEESAYWISKRPSREAKERLIVGHTRLAMKVISQMRCLFTSYIHSEDLLQEAYIGISEAVDRYQPDKGAKFSTYACWYIRKQVQEYARRNHDLIRYPLYWYNGQHEDLYESIIRQRATNTQDPVVIDSPIGSVTDHRLLDPVMEIINKDTVEYILSMLKPQERVVLQMRMEGMTTLEIGDYLNVTRGRISVIERTIRAKIQAQKARLGYEAEGLRVRKGQHQPASNRWALPGCSGSVSAQLL